MIVIGSDHAGYRLKESVKRYLDNKGKSYTDVGTYSEESCDYPYIAERVARQVADDNRSKGILICGSGIGMSIAANKIKGIRAALCMSPELAEMSRRHNDANILCLGARFINSEEAEKMISVFIDTEFEGGRHAKRVEEIGNMEK